MSAPNPFYRDTETLELDDLIAYIKEEVDRCGNSKSILASFECSFAMGPRFQAMSLQLINRLSKEGYKCWISEEFSTCPTTGTFQYFYAQKL